MGLYKYENGQLVQIAGGGSGGGYDDTEIRKLIDGKANKNEISTAINTANSYTDTKVADLVNSAPETLDTLGEVAKALQENETVVDALNSAIGNKADKSEIPSNYVTTNTMQQITESKVFSGDAIFENNVAINSAIYKGGSVVFNSVDDIQHKLTAGAGISIEDNVITSSSEIATKDQVSVALIKTNGTSPTAPPATEILTERAIATGLPYFNGKHNYTDATNYFVPTTSGTTGQILVANAEKTGVYGGTWADKQTGGEPTWKNPSELGLLTEDNAVFMPVGSIFSSAIPQTDARVHLLDGSTISQSGMYAEFATLLKSLTSKYAISCSAGAYESDLANFGQCGKFVIDNVAGTIRLPTITKFIEGMTSLANIGQSFSAGLPNITGTDRGVGSQSFGLSGAFYEKAMSGTGAVYQDASTNTSYTRTAFDASRSSSIYGKSSTVQPQSTAYPYYIVLAGGYKSTQQVNIDSVANDINTNANSIANLKTAVQTNMLGVPNINSQINISVSSGIKNIYTAPANGYVCFSASGASSDAYCVVFSFTGNTTDPQVLDAGVSNGMHGKYDHYMIASIPVKKGDKVCIRYNLSREGKAVFVPAGEV